jgi:hypothetical protein
MYKTRKRYRWAPWIVFLILALGTIGLRSDVDNITLNQILSFTFVAGFAILFIGVLMIGEPQGLVHIDHNGLTFHKRKRSVIIRWDNVKRIKLTKRNPWPRAHVFMNEPIPEGPPDFGRFYYNMAFIHGNRHLMFTSRDWGYQQVLEIYSSMKEIFEHRGE